MIITKHFIERFKLRVDPQATLSTIREEANLAWERGKKPDPLIFQPKKKIKGRVYEGLDCFMFLYRFEELGGGEIEPVAVTIFDRSQSELDRHRAYRAAKAQPSRSHG